MYPEGKIQFYDNLDIFTFVFMNVINVYSFDLLKKIKLIYSKEL